MYSHPVLGSFADPGTRLIDMSNFLSFPQDLNNIARISSFRLRRFLRRFFLWGYLPHWHGVTRPANWNAF